MMWDNGSGVRPRGGDCGHPCLLGALFPPDFMTITDQDVKGPNFSKSGRYRVAGVKNFFVQMHFSGSPESTKSVFEKKNFDLPSPGENPPKFFPVPEGSRG